MTVTRHQGSSRVRRVRQFEHSVRPRRARGRAAASGGTALRPSTPRRQAIMYAKISQAAHAISPTTPTDAATSSTAVTTSIRTHLPARLDARARRYELCGKVVLAKSVLVPCEVHAMPWVMESDLAGPSSPSLGKGYYGSETMICRYEPEGDEPAVVVVFRLGRDGILRCQSVKFDVPDGVDREIRRRDLDLPLEDMADWYRDAVAKVGEPAGGWVSIELPSTADLPAVRKRVSQARAGARRRASTDSKLAEVAKVYRDALAQGGRPTAAVAAFLGRSHRTASDYIRRARDRGYLGAALGPGIAGEGSVALMGNEEETDE